MINPTIVEYIKQHRNTYTRAAIEKQLATAGYNEADVAAAWTAVESGTDTLPPPPPDAGDAQAQNAYAPGVVPQRRGITSYPIFWVTLVGFILLSYGIPSLMTFIASTIAIANLNLSWMFWAALLVYGILQLGAFIGGLRWHSSNRPVGLGLLIGLLMTNVVLPFVAGVILFGICIAALSGVIR